MITPVLSAILLAQGGIPVGKTAPEFLGNQWLNSDKSLKMEDRKGKITLVYFWTFACYNCKNNMPAVKHLTETFAKDGVATISIHTPEIQEEREVANVKRAVERYGIKYPVLIDGSSANWRAWGNRYWPCIYVIDKHNKIRGGWEGELNFGSQNGEGKMSSLIRQLLKES
jgi:peroxiredoxin